MKEKKTFRPIPGLSREEEEKQLADIITVAQKNLTKTENRLKALSEELYDLMETYGPKDKEALSLLHNTQSQLQENKRDLLRCQKARKKPYFGRIDFTDSRLKYEESYYVGRVGISKSGTEPVVIDWRAPVASVYYENSVGPCSYTVKNEGTFEIELKRKRTYEIAQDRLKDFFDSDVVANDELLTKYLAKSKKAVLGEIIATIQKEQNAIIRKSPKTNLIVQGVAGSGKTTVAMHRISYILYNYNEEFRPEDFYIIGSNRILLNYITGVLPELDVYGVSQMTMEQLFVRLLYEDWDPLVHKIGSLRKNDLSACMKGSYEWFHDLEQFCKEYEYHYIPKEEIRLEKNGVLLMEEKTIVDYLGAYPQMSMQSKIDMLNEMLLARLENEISGKHISYTPAEKKELKRMYRWHFGKAQWKGSVFELYQEFLQVQEQKGKKIQALADTFDVYDLAALAYLYKRIKETDGIREASHVIIDEAQDFGMMAYGALAYCLRGCTYTIMGDVSQNIYFGYGLNDWKDLRELILGETNNGFGILKKSYRNTVEISNFATEILRHGNFPVYPVEPIIRHGNEVLVTRCPDEIGMLQETVKIIREWQKEGHETIAVICRDREEAAMVSEKLGQVIPLADCNLETTEFGSGVMVLPVEFTKGLEFDGVVIYHPSEKSYPAEDAYVKLLYVAATRALHELAVVHQGDLTDLIAKPVSEEKRMELLEHETANVKLPEKKKEVTALEQNRMDAQVGDRERELRNYIGPKPIVVQQRKKSATLDMGQQRKKSVATDIMQQGKTSFGLSIPGIKDYNCTQPGADNLLKKAQSKSEPPAPINPSPYQFWECPDTSLLQPKRLGRIDNSIRFVRRTKKYIDFTSRYGTLRLTPLEKGIIRVQFQNSGMADFASGYWNYQPQSPCSWTAREGKNLAEVSMDGITVRIDKKAGTLGFFDEKGKRLLAEKAELPRQLETGACCRSWIYFDWEKREKLFAKGILAGDLERMNQKARYISFGGKQLRMPLLVSEYGYGIAVACEQTVMCCAIPVYGNYLSTDGAKQIDYYFLYGGDTAKTLELYRKVSSRM